MVSTARRPILLAMAAIVGLSSASRSQETKPTILVPAEKCPEYVSLLQRYSTVSARRAGARDCLALLGTRDQLLRAMLAYGQNSSCYSYGWKGAEVVTLLQGLIDRNHAEKLRCEGWLASGRVCQDGSLCPAETICTAQRVCAARSKPTGTAPVSDGPSDAGKPDAEKAHASPREGR